MRRGIELRMSRELALWLGGIEPETMADYHALRRAGHLLIRATYSARPMFWPWAANVAEEIAPD